MVKESLAVSDRASVLNGVCLIAVTVDVRSKVCTVRAEGALM